LERFAGGTVFAPVKNPDATFLTPLEREIVALIAEGKSAKEIARSTALGPRTVERHLDVCRQKLGATNNAHLVAIVASSESLSTSDRP
jgi:DNA-binding CsgD family transcriptional regulator